METVGCMEVDVMTVSGMDENLFASSDQLGVDNVIPRPGMQAPDFWSPLDYFPKLKVVLPEVSRVPPEDYDVMTIKIKAHNFRSVEVTVVDSEYQYVLRQKTYNTPIVSLPPGTSGTYVLLTFTNDVVVDEINIITCVTPRGT